MGSYQWMYILLLVCFIYVEVMSSTECTTMSFYYNNSTDVTDHFRYVVKVGWKCKHCDKVFAGEKKPLQRWKVHLAHYKMPRRKHNKHKKLLLEHLVKNAKHQKICDLQR